MSQGELKAQIYVEYDKPIRNHEMKTNPICKDTQWPFHPFPRVSWGYPGGLDGKESACNAGDLDMIPGLGRSPGEGNGNPLQYSCLEKSMDRRAW